MDFEPFTFVLERLGDLLINELKFLSTDKKRLLESLQLELELARSFVSDVEEEKQQATITRVLQTQVQHTMRRLSEIEDFLDTLHQEEEVQQIQEQVSCFRKFMACFSCTSNPLIHRHLLIDKAKQLTEDLKATRVQAEPYKRQSERRQTRRRRPPTQPDIINDEFIIGLEEDVRSLVAKLVGQDGECTTVLVVVGMGGSGKTTLARKVYNHKDVMGHFAGGFRAWVCVSQEWDTPQLLREICAQAHIPLAEGETSMSVKVKLQEFLRGSSNYWVVLDDVWKKEALQELLPLLLASQVGGSSSRGRGRIMITTRNKEILEFPSLPKFHIHEARRLTREESWKLFLKIVRNKWQGIGSFDDESEFAQLGKEMLEKCDGLPLAIVAFAGLLSTKGTIQEWETVKNNVISMIMGRNEGFHDYGAVKEMLELSYDDLPYDLKPCFLYLGIFREDREIYVDVLTQLWIGEGFLRTDLSSECEKVEDLARNFLDELVQRCMVQVVDRDCEGEVLSIRIHDLIRDLCIGKAKELSFFEVSSSSSSPSTSMKPGCRRAILQSRKSYSIDNPGLRSVIHFYEYSSPIQLQLAYEKMKLLRVLHLDIVDLGDSAEQIGNFILLRYLRIQGCVGGTDLLLESIKRLRNLLTFIYRWNGEVTIPNNMLCSMEHLRYLSLEAGRFQGPVLGFERLRNLQYLRTNSGEWSTRDLCFASVIDSLQALNLERIDGESQLKAISNFVSNQSNHLQELYLCLEDGSSLEFDLQKMKLECCRLLKGLILVGQIRKQHEPLLFPPNLLRLELIETKIEKAEDLEKALVQLDRLRCLSLRLGSYYGDKLTMTGLRQLQELALRGLPNLKEWRIEEGALCQLKKIEIRGCKELERIPKGISHIRTLQYFIAVAMSKEFCERLRRPSEKEDDIDGGSGGEDFHLIQHIPSISLGFTTKHS